MDHLGEGEQVVPPRVYSTKSGCFGNAYTVRKADIPGKTVLKERRGYSDEYREKLC